MTAETTGTHGGAREGAGAPLGNQNSIKSNRLFSETIKRMVTQSEGEVVRRIATALIDKAAEGDMSAIKEFADRLDGKSMQENKVTGDADAPLVIQVVTGIDDNY
jgi:hypothetical protein